MWEAEERAKAARVTSKGKGKGKQAKLTAWKPKKAKKASSSDDEDDEGMDIDSDFKAPKGEPCSFFRTHPKGWKDCAAGDIPDCTDASEHCMP